MPVQRDAAISDPDQVVDLEELIREVVPDWKQWMSTPNPVLGGERPVDLLHTPRENILRDMLRAAKNGMAS